jgi:hypothetical protein
MRWGLPPQRQHRRLTDGDAGGAAYRAGSRGGGIRLGGGALVVIVIASLIFGVNPSRC